MEKLKRVHQLDKHGCTIACLAMLTDMSYFMVREMTQFKIPRLTNQAPVHPEMIGLYPIEFRYILREIYDIPCRLIRFAPLKQTKKHCVLWITPLTWEGGGSHVIVFDAKRRRILDPMDYVKNLDQHNVACCLEIDDASGST